MRQAAQTGEEKFAFGHLVLPFAEKDQIEASAVERTIERIRPAYVQLERAPAVVVADDEAVGTHVRFPARNVVQIRHRQHGQAAVDRLRDAAGEGVGDAADVRPAGIGVRIAERAEHPRQIVRPRQIPRNAVFAAVSAPAVVDLRTDVAGERGKIPVVQSPECAGALEQILQTVGQREVVPLHTV